MAATCNRTSPHRHRANLTGAAPRRRRVQRRSRAPRPPKPFAAAGRERVVKPFQANDISLMAWFRKEKKPRQPRRERLEIPADVWEKCEACGHTDIREKFWRNLNVCPNCDFHRRIRASDYANLLLDDGTMEEVEVDLRSTDPLGFPDYPAR